MRVVVGLMLIVGVLLAREGIIKEILSENEVVLEYQGKPLRAKLAGVASFRTANVKSGKVSYQKREELQSRALEFLGEHLPRGKRVRFIKIDNEGRGPQLIWISLDGGKELNYQMLKQGYAILDANDPYLLGSFYMRLKRAMNYAKEQRAGLWRDEYRTMKALVHMPSYYGSRNKNVSKEEILDYLLQKMRIKLDLKSK
ncbi:MAG: hypothetical protein GXO16_08135 [Epsilonproteobacteria bacterium]|nr:hypothetical protein [Campylobacterota bacterium]